MTAPIITPLSSYHFKQAGARDSLPCHDLSSSTTDIFSDLLHHNIIKNPYFGKNELSVQWVAEEDWIYHTSFEPPLDLPFHILQFDGLDTFAKVYLDDTLILTSQNQFHSHSINISRLITSEIRRYRLSIHFSSALKQGQLLEHKHGRLIASNGDSSRVYVRKSQHHYGWDWGPKLIGCGISGPIKLVSFHEAFVDSVYALLTRIDGEKWQLAISWELRSPEFEPDWEIIDSNPVKVRVYDPSGGLILDTLCCDQRVTLDLNPRLWFPRGYGALALYTIKVGHKVLHHGFRKVELVQEKYANEPGKLFYFTINDVPVFCLGSNWIPCDMFSSRVSPKDITQWLEIAAKGGQNCIRVWGGGYYEDEHFYNECDRLGLLVLQDFMFACAQYPNNREFEESVAKEVQDQVTRLRNHPCIIHYFGNNEDYILGEELGFEPQRHLYEKVIPKVFHSLCDTLYTYSLPYGGGLSNLALEGDFHQWNIWHGSQEKYQGWGKLLGRFVLEFGMEAYPDLETLSACVGQGQLYPQSPEIEFHNKAGGFELRLAKYLAENLDFSRENLTLKRFIYLTQLLQSECVLYAYKSARRAWKNHRCGGALVWQLNDCWPCISWSIVDNEKREKMAYWAIKRESLDVLVNFERRELLKATGKEPEKLIDSTHDYRPREYLLELWGSSIGQPLMVDVEIKAWSLAGALLLEKRLRDVELEGNTSTELWKQSLDSEEEVFCAVIKNRDGVLARAYNWPQPLKHWPLARKPAGGLLENPLFIQCRVFSDSLMISTNKPVKGLVLKAGLKKIQWSDNGFDLCPGDLKLIRAPGLKYDDVLDITHY